MKTRSVVCATILLALLCSANAQAQNPFSENSVEILFNQSGNDTNTIITEIENISDEISSILDQPQAENQNDYEVVKGNTLSGIARRFLGEARRWRELVEWNMDRYPSLLKNPDLILIGWKLRLSPPSAENTNIANETAKQNETIRIDREEDMKQNDTSPNNSTGSNETSATAPANAPLITPDSRVLHIGDSHTCGIYGKAMDELMRGTGAAINTVGVSGSSPSWWLNGTVGKSGYFAKDENGNVDQPADWRTPRQTPNLNKLIKDFKPGIIVFSLGANMINSSSESIRNQVRSVCELAKNAGCQIVWIGPPNGRADKKPTEKQNRLYNNLKAEAEKFGTFVDSRQYTRYPESGGDGVHFWGSEGSKIAKDWAGKVFNQLQKK